MAEKPKKKKLLKISKTDSQELSEVSAVTPEIEDYQILDKLGEGGMGSVWRAVQLSTHREVALKVMVSDVFGSDKARSRFEREVELAARLEHPNVTRIYESGLHQGRYYYTMELIQGEYLDQYIESKQLTQRQILELIHSVCQAVQYAHQRGVIHRDLKPSNIIVTDDSQPHILDFGLAKMLLEEEGEDEKKWKVSESGDIFGTPAYMSPEQAAGHLDEIDTRTDVYSLGIIIFNLLTNKWPYDLSGSRYEMLRNIQEEGPIRPSKIVPRFDSEIEAILLKALAKKPSDRYQSAAELTQDIRSWLDGLPISARSVDLLYLLRKFIVRYRTASIVVGLLLVIIVSTSFISLYSYSQVRSLLGESQLREEQTRRDQTFRQQVALDLFLERWHSGDLAHSGEILIFFDPDSREGLAARFFLDVRPFDQKKADYQDKLAAEQPSFWWFVVGEYYLKKGNQAATIKAYRQCLDAEDKSSELDDWYINKAKRRLNELSNNDG